MNLWVGGLLGLAIAAPTGLFAWWVLRDIERDVTESERRFADDLSAAGEPRRRDR